MTPAMRGGAGVGAEPWFFCQRGTGRPAGSQPALRLFMFPPAGADATLYRSWEQDMPSRVELCAIRLPGRGGRLGEPLLPDARRLAAAIADGIRDSLERPFVFFGHSMGALIAYETACRLQQLSLPLPEQLIVSAMRAPQQMNRRGDGCFARLATGDDARAPLHTLDDAALCRALEAIGGIPEAILRHRDYLQMLLPIFRNDLSLCEGYVNPQPHVLPLAITALGGTTDAVARRDELAAWAQCGSGPFSLQLFPGGHFYFSECQSLFHFALRQLLQGQMEVSA